MYRRRDPGGFWLADCPPLAPWDTRALAQMLRRQPGPLLADSLAGRRIQGTPRDREPPAATVPRDVAAFSETAADVSGANGAATRQERAAKEGGERRREEATGPSCSLQLRPPPPPPPREVTPLTGNSLRNTWPRSVTHAKLYFKTSATRSSVRRGQLSIYKLTFFWRIFETNF